MSCTCPTSESGIEALDRRRTRRIVRHVYFLRLCSLDVEDVPGGPSNRGRMRCARCDATISLRRPGIRWCPACGVFLCESCSRSNHAGGATHRLHRSGSMLILLFLLIGITFAPIAGVVYAVEQQDLARANIPVTSISNLVPGTLAKINGTVASPSQVVIRLVGSGSGAYWLPSPFNVSDPTGIVFVDPTPLAGSSSYRVIETGVHDDAWRNGDPISVIGSVRAAANGTPYVIAQYIARSPTLFYRPGFETPLTATIAAAGIAGTVVSGYSNRRRTALHRRNAPAFHVKVREADVCRDCGAPLPEGTEKCPSCGGATGMTGRSPDVRPGGGAGILPVLRLERRFSERSPAEKGAVVGFGLVLPALLLLFGAWLLLTAPLGIGLTPVYLFIFGVVMAGVFAKDYFTAETAVLSPERIETRGLWKTRVVDPNEVDLVLTIHRRKRSAHVLITRGDEFVGFGPGTSREDFERAREWLKAFASQRGLDYRDVDVREAVQLMAHRKSGRLR